MLLAAFGLRARRLSWLALPIALAACGETTANEPLPVQAVVAVTGAGQSGLAGQLLPSDITVRVLASDGNALPGTPVTFSVTAGGGSADPATATTDGDGLARTRWRLGTAIGGNTLTATAGGVVATFNATATAGRPASVSIATGNNQVAAAGSAVPLPPAVLVVDATGNPVSGAPVTFTVVTGSGQAPAEVRRTNNAGIADAGNWILGPNAGTQTLAARVEENGVTNNPVLFTATATAGAAAVATAASATTQSATVGTPVGTAPSVKVTDANGNPVANVRVTFRVTLGNGTLTGATPNTNAAGIASLGSWILGPTTGAQQVAASVQGLPDITFNATASAGNASQLVIAGGNNQRAQIGRAVAVAPSVAVRDALGNGVAGVVVNFAVASGGGTAVGGRQVTDASGIAQVGAWLLGDAVGANTLTATAAGLPAVTFTAIGDPGRATSMAANSSIAQGGTAGALVTEPPSVIVRDGVGNPVSGIAVSFAVTSGGGTVSGSPVTTDANGVATVTSWRLGATAGTNTVVASAAGLASVTFTATAGAGAPTLVAIVAGNNQVALQGTVVPVRPSVKVTDANGNPVSGVTVTFAVTAGGGSVSGATQLTDAAGVATVANWTLGNASPNTLRATVTGAGITGNPISFSATSATAIAVTSAPVGPINRDVAFSISVRLQDAAGGNVALSSIPLTIAMSGAGTPTGTLTVNTDALGIATFTIAVPGSAAAGARTFTISGTGLTSAVTAAITFN